MKYSDQNRSKIRDLIVYWLSMALLTGQVGCAPLSPYETKRETMGFFFGYLDWPYQLPTPPEEARTRFGTIGLVSARFVPEGEFQVPAKGKTSGVGRGAAKGALSTVSGGCIGGAQSGDPLGFLVLCALGIALAPVGAVVGGTVGVGKAQPAEKVEKEEISLKEALAKLKIQEEMLDHVTKIATDQTRYKFILLTEHGPTDARQTLSYSALKDIGIDTVLELSVRRIGLEGLWSANPPLTFFMTLHVRLIRTEDGKVFYDHILEYRSMERTFSDWATNNAKPFLDELSRSYLWLAEKTIDDNFLIYNLPSESATNVSTSNIDGKDR